MKLLCFPKLLNDDTCNLFFVGLVPGQFTALENMFDNDHVTEEVNAGSSAVEVGQITVGKCNFA